MTWAGSPQPHPGPPPRRPRSGSISRCHGAGHWHHRCQLGGYCKEGQRAHLKFQDICSPRKETQLKKTGALTQPAWAAAPGAGAGTPTPHPRMPRPGGVRECRTGCPQRGAGRGEWGSGEGRGGMSAGVGLLPWSSHIHRLGHHTLRHKPSCSFPWTWEGPIADPSHSLSSLMCSGNLIESWAGLGQAGNQGPLPELGTPCCPHCHCSSQRVVAGGGQHPLPLFKPFPREIQDTVRGALGFLQPLATLLPTLCWQELLPPACA